MKSIHSLMKTIFCTARLGVLFLIVSVSANHTAVAGIVAGTINGTSTVVYDVATTVNGIGLNNVFCTTVPSGSIPVCSGSGALPDFSSPPPFSLVELYKLDAPPGGQGNSASFLGSSHSSYTTAPSGENPDLVTGLPLLPFHAGVHTTQLQATEFRGTGDFGGLPLNQSISTSIHASFLVDSEGLAEHVYVNNFNLFFGNITDLEFRAVYRFTYVPLGETTKTEVLLDNNLTFGLFQGTGGLTSDGTVGVLSEIGGVTDILSINLERLSGTALIGAVEPDTLFTVDAAINLQCSNDTVPLSPQYQSNFSCGLADLAFSNASVVPIPPSIFLFISGLAGFVVFAFRRKNETSLDD